MSVDIEYVERLMPDLMEESSVPATPQEMNLLQGVEDSLKRQPGGMSRHGIYTEAVIAVTWQ